MMTTLCTYVHMKPDLTPFYVGKGTVRRAHTLTKTIRSAILAAIQAPATFFAGWAFKVYTDGKP